MERAHARAAALHAARARATSGGKRRGHADRARWHAAFGLKGAAFFVRLTYPRALGPEASDFASEFERLYASITGMSSVGQLAREIGPDDIDDVRIVVQLDPNDIRVRLSRTGMLPSSPEAQGWIQDRIATVESMCVRALESLSSRIGDIKKPENTESDGRVSVRWLSTEFVIDPRLHTGLRRMLGTYDEFAVRLPVPGASLSRYDSHVPELQRRYELERALGAVLVESRARNASHHSGGEHVRVTYPRSYTEKQVDGVYEKLEVMVGAIETCLRDYRFRAQSTVCEASDVPDVRVAAAFDPAGVCVAYMAGDGGKTDVQAAAAVSRMDIVMREVRQACKRALGGSASDDRIVLEWAPNKIDARLEADLPAMLRTHGAFSLVLFTRFNAPTVSFARGDQRAGVYSLLRRIGATFKPPSIKITMQCTHHTLGSSEAAAQFRRENRTLPLHTLNVISSLKRKAEATACGEACGARVEVEDADAKLPQYIEAAALIITSNPGVRFGRDRISIVPGEGGQ
jgi:hypothetical protein